ncbi:hypothetical protein PMW_72 [Pseudomonas phage phiPMW]|uniref:Uncharacterized protein n=1 Tax=Pseudomonas phage phiPMW TaxID=1815582 RepID=A0A1S5R1D7_9CAUD|nr:hypothetical protein FDG97_gp072 [Pseudomonas phage phiPMW]ANA49197.1 hypothetical protein PMW_72 [Pseudomonas phage phiPMW]
MNVKAFVQVTVVNTYDGNLSTTSQIIEAASAGAMDRMVQNLVETYRKLNVEGTLHHLIVTVL